MISRLPDLKGGRVSFVGVLSSVLYLGEVQGDWLSHGGLVSPSTDSPIRLCSFLDTSHNDASTSPNMSFRMTADSTVPPSPTSETVLTVAAFGEREKVGSGGWEAHA